MSYITSLSWWPTHKIIRKKYSKQMSRKRANKFRPEAENITPNPKNHSKSKPARKKLKLNQV